MMQLAVVGPRRRVAVLQGETVVDVNSAFAVYARDRLGEPRPQALSNAWAPPDLADLIQAGPPALERITAALDYLAQCDPKLTGVTGECIVQPAASVTFHRPQVVGARLACVGGNYGHHMAAYYTARGTPTTPSEAYQRGRANGTPSGFWKMAAATGPDDDVVYPPRTRYFDFEGELAIVLSRPALNVTAADLPSYIWGVTLFNDWSIRDEPMLPAGLNFYAMFKNFDSGSSLGPTIAVGDVDLDAVEFETWVNGECRQRGSTRDMIYTFGECLEYLSRGFTLQPGDVIAGGTPLGTAIDSTPTNADGSMDPKLFLKAGDVVELRSPDIGTLRNRIVAATPDVPS